MRNLKLRLSREESRELTREKLLASAQAIVAEHGFSGSSVSDIAENAGYSKGAFFAHFDSKDAVMLELLRRHQQRNVDLLDGLLKNADDGAEAMTAINAYLSTLNADRQYAMLAVEMKLHATRNPEFAAAYDPMRRDTQLALAQLIVEVFRKAGVTPPAPSEALADLFVAIVQGLTLHGAENPASMLRLVLGAFLGKDFAQQLDAAQLPQG